MYQGVKAINAANERFKSVSVDDIHARHIDSEKSQAGKIIGNNPNEWVVIVQEPEVCVVHRDNHHGIISYGWYGDYKILIGKAGDNEYKNESISCLLKLADKIANDLNNKDE